MAIPKSSLAKRLSLTLLVLLLCVTFAQGQENELTVNVNVPDLGVIQGRLGVTSRDQKQYWTFHGIPYADNNSYVGQGNRFKPSKVQTRPLTADGSVFKANQLFVYCPQGEIFNLDGNETERERLSQDLPEMYRRLYRRKRNLSAQFRSYANSEELKRAYADHPLQTMGQEDCLTININTPKIPENPLNDEELLPVVVFFHGGGSDSVWGSAFTALRMLEHDVLLVTMNYRLGALGAFNLGIDDAPGNAGQYDGLTCLEWVQKYIRYFGGNPNLVTISGQSAGAMMVANLMITPLAKDKGLFHRVWGFSGSALSVWATAEQPSLRHHMDLAGFAGCRNPEMEDDVQSVADCMQRANLSVLVTAMELYKDQETYNGRLGFDAKMPSIQAPSLSHPLFMPKHPLEVLEAGEQSKVPIVFGATRHDGSFPLDDIYNNFLKPRGLDKNETFVKNEMMELLLRNLGINDDTGELYHTMTKTYLRNASTTGTFEDKIPGMLDMVTVMAFKAGEMETLRLHTKLGQKGYFYSFDYTGRWSLYNFLWGEMDIPGGVCHTNDLIYFFWLGPLLNDDMKVSRRWMNYFINFVKSGDPNEPVTPKVMWEAYNPMTHPYMKLDHKDQLVYNAQDEWVGAADELFIPQEEGEPTTTTQSPGGSESTTQSPGGSESTTTNDSSDETGKPTAGTGTQSVSTSTTEANSSILSRINSSLLVVVILPILFGRFK